jgi:hypothetical protein
MAGGIDDILKEMEKDDLEGATKLPPIQYGKLRGIYPQKVYAALRAGRLKWDRCECGRRVVNVEEADKLFKLGAYRADKSGQADSDDGREGEEAEREVSDL